MKRVIIGTIVATIIYFAYQSVMWMGGFHDFKSYSRQQDTVLQVLHTALPGEGMYMVPTADPASPNRAAEEEQIMKNNTGKPWAVIFYHEKMEMNMSTMLIGFLYVLIACLMAAMIIYHGRFASFGSRFCVSMAIAVFTLFQGVLDDYNWWHFHWEFIQPQVTDLILGWGICSLWLAAFVKHMPPKTTT